MKYWIIVDSEQLGPFTPDELRRFGDKLTASTPVWHDGLPDWLTAGEIDETAAIIAEREQRPPLPPIPYAVAPMPEPGIAAMRPTPAPQPATPLQGPEPEPSTYLIWNILATILCCLPSGIVGIIMSSKVSRRYDTGDIIGARSASEAAAWWLIVSIVLGLVAVPFQLIATLF